MNGNRAIVSGAGGFIGSALVRALRQANRDVLTIDTSELLNFEFGWRKAVDVDVVFHLAAMTDPVASTYKDNTALLASLLDLCVRQHFCPVIILASTITADLPKSLYDLHKRLSEMHLSAYSEFGACRGVVLRLANVYGPGDSTRPGRGILTSMIRRAMAGDAITIYGTGSSSRDYIYIDDVVAAFLAAAELGVSCPRRYRVFEIGTGTSTFIAEAFNLVADRVSEKTGRPRTPVEYVPDPILSRYATCDCDPSDLMENTTWMPRVALKDGIDATIDAMMKEEG